MHFRFLFSPEWLTVIELLSPSNKSGRDRQQYLAKRDQILDSPAHLVEIDLLRGGPLKPGDADVKIDLQQLLHEIHDAAGYAKYIYGRPLSPPLSTEDAAWAAELLG